MMTGGARVIQRDRQLRDWYPTPSDVTQALINVHPVAGMTLWEPCCGDGSMSKVLEKAGAVVICSDIMPLIEGAYTQDFLTTTQMPDGATGIVTNPPYKLAAQFIEHAMNMKPDFVAMLLKSTFWHAARRYTIWRKYRPSHIHPLLWRPDFLNLGAPAMDFMWACWIADHSGPTVYEPLPRPGIYVRGDGALVGTTVARTQTQERNGEPDGRLPMR